MVNKILLSICIPTYNRAKFLEVCLDSIVNQINEDMPIELIVSDNFSSDNTLEIISKYSNLPYFRLIKQKSNLGPMLNGLGLVKYHAKGEFCWYIGDDDYLVPGAIKNLLYLIENLYCDFIFLNIEPIGNFVNFKDYQLFQNPSFEILPSFNYVLLPKYSQIFGGELMASVFKREIFLQEKEVYNHINKEYLSTLETSYLHCVIFANQFMGRPAVYIKDIMVLADNRAREWSDKSAYLVVEQLFNLLSLYKKNGLEINILNQCNKHYINISLGNFLKFVFKPDLNYRNRISFKRYFFFLIQNPILTLSVLNNFIFRFLRTR